MNKIRGLIRIVALLFVTLAVGLYGYYALTDVTKDEMNEVIVAYSEKCGITIEGGVKIFGYSSYNRIQQYKTKLERSLISARNIQLGQGGVSDFIAVSWGKLHDAIGQGFKQRIDQAGMQAGILALDDDMEKCDLPSIIANETKVNSHTQKNQDSSIALVSIPEPASDCDMDFDITLKNAGFVADAVSVHGPDDDDFAGYGCPYRISPEPGSKAQVGSVVSFRSAWEGG